MVCSGKDDMEALLDRLDRLGDRHVIPAHAEWFVEPSPFSVTYLEGEREDYEDYSFVGGELR